VDNCNWLKLVVMADVSWHRSRFGIGWLEEFDLQLLVEYSRGECKRRIGEIKGGLGG